MTQIEETALPLDIQVGNLLHRNAAVQLHQLLDIPLEIAQHKCAEFRAEGQKYLNNVKQCHDRTLDFRDSWDALRKRIASDLLAEAQKHG